MRYPSKELFAWLKAGGMRFREAHVTHSYKVPPWGSPWHVVLIEYGDGSTRQRECFSNDKLAAIEDALAAWEEER